MNDVFNPSTDLRHLYDVNEKDRSLFVNQYKLTFARTWKCGTKTTFRCYAKQHKEIDCKFSCVLVHATGEIIFGNNRHSANCTAACTQVELQSKLLEEGFCMPGKFVLMAH